MEIKTSLKQLGTFFAQSASTEELTVPVRRFAAQLTILTAHIQRIEATAKRVTDDLEKRIETFEGLIAAAQQASAPATTNGASSSPVEGEPPGADMNEESEADAMAAKVQAETEAELAAITNGAPEPVVVMPTPRKNGGKKAPQAGGAA
jgi:hypothetical protein